MKCIDCGAPAEHRHHVVPKSLGGRATVPLCLRCHGLVHGKDLLSMGNLARSAHEAKRAAGGIIGWPPYGYDVCRDSDSYVPRADEQAVIAWACAQRLAGATYQAIVDALAGAGARSRKGRPLAIASVHALTAPTRRSCTARPEAPPQ